MSDCGVIEFATGATLQSSTLLNGEVQNSTITGSAIDTARLTNLTSIDDASVQLIALAISDLPKEQLAILAKAIMDALGLLQRAEETRRQFLLPFPHPPLHPCTSRQLQKVTAS